jgi:hypothetical protein|tara:strand:+ start:1226 stop:1402 length:177 start_codon:yes stop_codon:yes gene_type:complete
MERKMIKRNTNYYGGLADVIEEWLDTHDEWLEREEVSNQVQPYRKKSEDTKISDQSES